MRGWLVPAVAALALGYAPSLSAEGGPVLPPLGGERPVHLWGESPEAVPWAKDFLALLGVQGEGAGALTVLQTEYEDPLLGNVVLLIWDGPASGAEVEVYLDGTSVGTQTNLGLLFVSDVEAGHHVFRVEEKAEPGSSVEGEISVLAEQPFDDPTGLRCEGSLQDSELTCAITVAWTNPLSLPSYYLVFVDDETGVRTSSAAATSISLAGVAPGDHEVTLAGFLRASPGNSSTLYRGGILKAPCPVTSCDPEPRFLRGACGQSGSINIASAVFLLNFLFIGGNTPACLAACDSDANGILVITDAVYLLNYLFLGGTAPAGWVDQDLDGTADPTCEAALPEQCSIGQMTCRPGA